MILTERILTLERKVRDAAIRLQRDLKEFDPAWVRDFSFEEIRAMPVLICGSSMFGSIVTAYGKMAGARFFGVVDDYQIGKSIHGLPVLSSVDLLRWCREHPETICVNASLGVGGWKHFGDLAADFGLRILDWQAWLRLAGIPIGDRVFASWQPYILERLEEYLALGSELVDEHSVYILLKLLLFHITTDRSLLLDLYLPCEWSYFQGGSFRLHDREVLVDGGANVGQTVARFTTLTQRRFVRVHSFEPDRTNVIGLRELVAGLRIPDSTSRIRIHEAALGECVGTAVFDHRGTEGSRLLRPNEQSIGTPTRVETIDHAVDDPVTLIKLDVEGFEAAALAGAHETIRRYKPRLAVCVYHAPADPIEIVRLLKEMDVGYRFSLRLHSASFYDLVLYAC
jgi:FkbM family methyltransferase